LFRRANPNIEFLIYALAKAEEDKQIYKKIFTYIIRTRFIKLEINGEMLRDLGLKQGEQIGFVLGQLISSKIDGELKTLDHEKKYAQKLIKNLK
ncbi:hypothetical protein ACFL5N_00100, partial [bacterium]